MKAQHIFLDTLLMWKIDSHKSIMAGLSWSSLNAKGGPYFGMKKEYLLIGTPPKKKPNESFFQQEFSSKFHADTDWCQLYLLSPCSPLDNKHYPMLIYCARNKHCDLIISSDSDFLAAIFGPEVSFLNFFGFECNSSKKELL